MSKTTSFQIPVSRPLISKRDVHAVAQAVKSTFIANGPSIYKFESQIARYCQRKYAVAVSNGTQALYLALKSLDLPKKSKILVPSFTIVSALFAIIESGHIPYFSDAGENTWNITEKGVRKGIKDGIKAAIIVETYAAAPPMEDVTRLLHKYHIPMIEDAAEGFGGAEKGKKFGSFGDLSTLSFYSNKLITMGEGGMILTNDQSLYNRLCMLRNLFFDNDRTFIHKQLSSNTRITNYQAALGISQLERINSFYRHRQKLYTLYVSILRPLQEKIQFQFIPENLNSSYWVFPILLKKNSLYTANDFIKKLNKSHIEARHFFYPLDKQPFIDKKYKIDSRVSKNLWKYGLYLPLGNGITEVEVKTVASVVKKILLN